MLVEQNSKVEVERWKIAKHVVNLETSIIREILKISSQPGVISFAGGLPAPELFPEEGVIKAVKAAFDEFGSSVLQYSLSSGIPELRKVLAERATGRGTHSELENILIVSGAQQGIELVARAFIDPGDYILTENPTYLGALQAFNYYQARYATVEMDDEGMLIDQVHDQIHRYSPKLIYTVSNFQNPTGISMSAARRRQLVDIATEHHIPIVDDNPYGDIRFKGENIPTLKSMGGDEVIAVRSFSKVLSPGIRCGWMNGPAKIMPQFEKVKQCTDLHTAALTQYMVYEFIKLGLLEPHIERIKKDYLAKCNTMLDAMKAEFPDSVRWTEAEGGLFIWGVLPEGVSSQELFHKAVEQKVAFVPGRSFYPNGGGENTFRLNFSNATHENIVEGIRRLGKLFKQNL